MDTDAVPVTRAIVIGISFEHRKFFKRGWLKAIVIFDKFRSAGLVNSLGGGRFPRVLILPWPCFCVASAKFHVWAFWVIVLVAIFRAMARWHIPIGDWRSGWGGGWRGWSRVRR